MTKLETYGYIVGNCSYNRFFVYRLAYKKHPNSNLALTVDKISEANLIECFILDFVGNTFTANQQIERKWSYRIS